MRIVKTYVEYQETPLGLDIAKPRLSWILEEEGRNRYQTAYRIQTAVQEDFTSLLWDTGKVNGKESIQIPYTGPALESCKRYYYQVKVWNQNQEESSWSETGWFETAWMNAGEWEADWITPEYDFQAPKTACPILRKEFSLDKGAGSVIKSARIYASAKGVYELWLNGNKVGDSYLTPGWTSYNKRLLYQIYDVTNQVSAGRNALGAMIGSGWYKGELGWRSRRNVYGGREALILELHVTYEDGTTERIVSDATWKSSYRGPILYAENYHGETYDARLELPFDQVGLCTDSWFGVRTMGRVSKEILRAQECESVKIKEVRKPAALLTTPKGEVVLDMGQNMTGWIRFRVSGRAGDCVILSHAETLDHEGNFYVDNLKGAKQKITYFLKGEAEEEYRPHFTFQGFRYVRIEAFPGVPCLDQFDGLVLYSDLTQTGHFSCSDPLVNRLYQNALWSQKGNFVDIPTDCPQRCERLGWTADIQMFAATAAYNMGIPRFITKWLRDLAAEQFPSGGVPWVVPDIYDDTYAYDLAGYTGQSEQTAAAWGDAAVICPWILYQHYGDKRILEEQYESMCRYIEYIYQQGDDPYTWDTGHQLGDWVALDAPYGSFIGATDLAYVATAYYAYSTEILYRTAGILDKEEEAVKYQKRYEKIQEGFRKRYLLTDGTLSVKTQTAIVLALQFRLIPEADCQALADELAAWIQKTNYDLITGFVGTPYLCHVLTQYGHVDTAYGLLMKKEYPSWLYQVTKGATTIWEHLDGMKPDGTMWNPRMNSFNHYAYGSVAEWLYKTIGGIAPSEQKAGFEQFRFAPVPGGGLTVAAMDLMTMYGQIQSAWEIQEHSIEYKLSVPVNTCAEILLPLSKDRAIQEITESGHTLMEADSIIEVGERNGKVRILVGSGDYIFRENRL